MRTVTAFVVGGLVTAALTLARPSPADPTARWEYKVLDVELDQHRTPQTTRIDGESEKDRALRLAAPDPLIVPLAAVVSEGWELVSVVKDDHPNYVYFLRRAKP